MTTRDDKGGKKRPQEPSATFGFLLVPKFSMLAFTSALEPLRAANNISGERLFAWRVITVDGGPVAASNGVGGLGQSSIAEEEAHAASNLPDTLIVVSGDRAHEFNDRQTLNWLRWMARQGVRLGAVSTASYLLARAGLLDGYQCTIHWETLAAFTEEFPDLDVTDEVFEIDRNRLTCSGGTASMDMMLSLIGLEHGRELATGVAENFMHERIRDTHDHQRMALRTRLGISHPKLLSVISLMEEHLEEPLSRAELAERAGLSTRQLERLFRKYLSRTPTRYYLELRLHKARQLLAQTSMSVLDVALACGFVSASHFSKCYREYFDRTPREERNIPA
ncbi:MAG: GlxA family transcriptional regulator [Rhodovibrionaceae bacterium]|nr:GlxA family transcriptional regulator [Rhodovibrionaceae bacterium]